MDATTKAVLSLQVLLCTAMGDKASLPAGHRKGCILLGAGHSSSMRIGSLLPYHCQGHITQSCSESVLQSKLQGNANLKPQGNANLPKPCLNPVLAPVAIASKHLTSLL